MPGDLDALTAVRDAVAIVCEVEPATLTGATRFADLGADSLARVSIADVVEATLAEHDRRALHIDDASLGRMASLADLAEYVVDRSQPAGPLPASANPVATR
jgi:acyl carrier protein